ncbi:MAG TPA: hypothetical protein PLZ06_06155 [Clostridia bacterium]|nr:hypothetical protein [Clostridia bacterium]HQC68714.1 hypothetical protein [Clostridia bacterium]
MSNRNYNYFVEGETEACLIRAIRQKYIQSGRITKINLLEKDIPSGFIKTIKPFTILIIVFDTDVDDMKLVERLKNNTGKLKKSSHVKDVILIPQVNNLEDEIKYATDISEIKDLLQSKSNKDFKRDFCKCNNVTDCLVKHSFNIEKFWSRKARNKYSIFENDGKKIKLKRRR